MVVSYFQLPDLARIAKGRRGQMNSIIIRALESSEWTAFRDFRLQGLKVAPGVFGSAYGIEETLKPEEWQSTVSGPAQQVFGLFDVEYLIGIMAAFTWREDPSGHTAVLAMSFMLPEYRGRGLSRLLYETRLDWIRWHTQFTRVVVSHRESNQLPRRAIERHGFRLVRRAPRVWPDGTTEDEIFYELSIRT
jgi:GNAT superfamily N-acetyltransferase